MPDPRSSRGQSYQDFKSAGADSWRLAAGTTLSATWNGARSEQKNGARESAVRESGGAGREAQPSNSVTMARSSASSLLVAAIFDLAKSSMT